MDLDFSEEQDMLRDTVARLCEDFHSGQAVRALERDERGYSPGFWQGMAAMGLCGLSLAEQYGGIALGSLETAIVHEEMGRTLANSPHLASSVMAASLLQDAGSEEQRGAWLSAIAAGGKILVPAWQEAGAGPDLQAVKMTVQSTGSELQLEGEKVLVPFAGSADGFLVAARDERGVLRVVIVPAEQASLRNQPNHADQNLAAVSFRRIHLPAEAALPEADIAACWDRALLRGQIALAAQAIGGASRMLEMATGYARERQQFGQPIGAFQSIAHYLADRATEVEGARYLVYQAAWACDNGEDWGQLALMAKLQATAVFRRTTVTGVQIHGGMGFSAEADPQLYYRRAKHLQLMHWDPRYLEQRIAAEVFR